MSSLTEQERLGLDDVFLSIAKHRKISLMDRLRRSADLAGFKLQNFRKSRWWQHKSRVKLPSLRFFGIKSHKKKKFLS